MPVFDFKCPNCGARASDVVLKITHSAQDVPKCPECDEPMEKQVSSGAGFILKGRDWPSQSIRRTGHV